MERKIKVLRDVARVVAELECTMRNDSIRKVMEKDLPLQDYLANGVDDCCPEDPLECFEYAGNVLDCLQEMQEHIEKGYQLKLSDVEREMTDILVGEAPNHYPSDFILLGKAVAAMVTKRLEGCNHRSMTRKEAGKFIADIVNDVKKMADDRSIDLFHIAYAEPLAYVEEWLWNRLHETSTLNIKD